MTEEVEKMLCAACGTAPMRPRDEGSYSCDCGDLQRLILHVQPDPLDMEGLRNSYLKTQVPWAGDHVLCKLAEIDAALQAAYRVGTLDAEFERWTRGTPSKLTE